MISLEDDRAEKAELIHNIATYVAAVANNTLAAGNRKVNILHSSSKGVAVEVVDEGTCLKAGAMVDVDMLKQYNPSFRGEYDGDRINTMLEDKP